MTITTSERCSALASPLKGECLSVLDSEQIPYRQEEIGGMLEFLGNYTKEYFAHEETVMDERRCSVACKNRELHRQFLKEYAQLVERYEREGTAPTQTASGELSKLGEQFQSLVRQFKV